MLLSRHNLASDLGNRHNSYQVTQKTFKTLIKQNFDHFPWSNLPNKKDIVHRCSFQRLWLFPQRLMGTLATSYLAFFSGWFLLGVHFNHCRNTWQAWRPRYWIDKEFHQKVSRAWKQEKALAFCTHIDFFCIKIISVKKSNIQEQLRKKSVIRYLQLHLKYHLKEKSWKHFSLFFSNLSMSFLQS